MILIYIQSFIRHRCHYIIWIVFSISLLSTFIHLTKTENKIINEQINNLLILAKNESFCSARSARRGFNQRILSVSAYESNDRIHLKTSLTWSYINIFVNEAKKFYPSWIVRVYYFNLINKTKNDIEKLEQLYDNLDFCDAENLPVLGNVKNRLPGKMQRFLPAIDPFVSVLLVRDLDSEIYQREVDAVNEWLLKTSYAFHIMRDHSQHKIPILGGLWGLATDRLSATDQLIIANALLPSNNENDIREFMKAYSDKGDQVFLADHIWPLARRNSLAHDSFSCLWSYYIYREDTRPFPTKRLHPTCFVGCPKPCCTPEMRNNTDWSSHQQCPSVCRPKDHKDWLFC